MAGRPRTRVKRDGYTPELGKRICDLVAEGKGLGRIEAMDGMPPRRTVRDWLERHPEFEHGYNIARKHRADSLVDEALELADSVQGCTDQAMVTAARLAVDTRKWLASKLLPQRFGDRIEVAGDPDHPLIPPAEIDNTKIAHAICNLLEAARPPVVIDAEPVEPAPAAVLPEPPRAAATILDAVPYSTDRKVVALQQRDRPRELPSNYYRGRT